MRKYLKDNRGFTLVEVLMVTVLLGIIVATVSPLIKNTFDNWEFSKEQVETQSNLRQVLDYVAKELRQAIPSEIVIDTDLSKISYVNSGLKEDFQIYLEGDTVKRSGGGLVGEPLTSPEVVVERLEFTCQESTNTGDRDQYQIVIKGHFADGGASQEFRTSVTPRVEATMNPSYNGGS